MPENKRFRTKAIFIGFLVWLFPLSIGFIIFGIQLFYEPIADQNQPSYVFQYDSNQQTINANNHQSAVLADELWYVQVASFSNPNYAKTILNRLEASGYHPIESKQLADTQEKILYVVRVGPFENEQVANSTLQRIKIEYKLLPKLIRISEK